ncbi:unnamed protein product [Mesocestoides corti]|uniref:G-protein coupled receptors family 1 profile domain-containing protein n=2 Tax=Mesocestoides corti TaxID=53468 RepID=A0A0R3U7T3_MESCO|nr:unnamed protein product [Mesocestoides corti]
MSRVCANCRVVCFTNCHSCQNKTTMGYQEYLKTNKHAAILNTVVAIELPIGFVGIFNNLICLYVLLCYRFTRHTTQRLVITESLIDMLIVFTCLLVSLECKSAIFEISLPWQLFSSVVLETFYQVIGCFQLYRTWVAVLIGLERYLLVCWPLLFRSRWTLAMVNVLLAVSAALALTVRSPLFVNTLLDLDARWMGTSLVHRVNALLDIIFQTVLPLTLLHLMSSSVNVTSMKTSQWRGNTWTLPNTPSKRNYEIYKRTTMRINRSMKVVRVVYTILMLPALPYSLLTLTRWHEHRDNSYWVVAVVMNGTKSLAHISRLLISTADFYIYVACWPRFRRLLGGNFRVKRTTIIRFALPTKSRTSCRHDTANGIYSAST